MRLLKLVAALAAILIPANANAARAPASGQPERGAAVAAKSCAVCHGPNLSGGPAAPALVGDKFVSAWSGKSAADLFTYIKTKMPPGQPGILSDTQYTDVVASILNANGFAARFRPTRAR